jgi:hypothetical protein
MDAAQVALYDYNVTLQQQISDLNAAAQAQQRYNQTTQQLSQQTASLQVQLARAQGNTALANQLQRAIDTQGMDAAQIAIYDYNQALQTQIESLNAAAAQEQAVAQQRQGLLRQLYQLEGDTASLRAMELAQLDPSNRALQQRIYDLQDEQAAHQQLQQQQQQQLAAVNALKSAWQGLTNSIFDEVRRIRSTMGTPQQNFATLQSQFAIATAQARAGDQYAAQQLPQLSQQMLEAFSNVAHSQLELAAFQGQTAANLQDTGDMLVSKYGLDNSAQMLSELQSMNARIDALQAKTTTLTTHAKTSADNSTKTNAHVEYMRQFGVFVKNVPGDTLQTATA